MNLKVFGHQNILVSIIGANFVPSKAKARIAFSYLFAEEVGMVVAIRALPRFVLSNLG